jgi:hypothetical protein
MLTSVADAPVDRPPSKTTCVGLFGADDLGAVGEEPLGRRNGLEFIEKWMR